MLQLRHFSKTYQGRAVLRIAGFDFAPGAYWIQGAKLGQEHAAPGDCRGDALRGELWGGGPPRAAAGLGYRRDPAGWRKRRESLKVAEKSLRELWRMEMSAQHFSREAGNILPIFSQLFITDT